MVWRTAVRKIIHVDMDAFYASVEQRDDPQLRGKPVIVAWRGKRSVVCAASYEARSFGVRSAMPAVRAEHLCPNGIFVAPAPDFPRYRAVSRSVREIFKRHTDLIEPLSLDEAYLDVTENKMGLPTATLVAKTIREQVRQELNLTASAGVAPNKFLAKLASDWRKPDGCSWCSRRRSMPFSCRTAARSRPGHRGKARQSQRQDRGRSAKA
jgi:DNA polymerase IV